MCRALAVLDIQQCVALPYVGVTSSKSDSRRLSAMCWSAFLLPGPRNNNTYVHTYMSWVMSCIGGDISWGWLSDLQLPSTYILMHNYNTDATRAICWIYNGRYLDSGFGMGNPIDLWGGPSTKSWRRWSSCVLVLYSTCACGSWSVWSKPQSVSVQKLDTESVMRSRWSTYTAVHMYLAVG